MSAPISLEPRTTASASGSDPRVSTSQPKDPVPWHRVRSVLVILFVLLLTWPIGLYGLWKALRDPQLKGTWVVVTFFCCVVALAASSLAVAGVVIGIQSLSGSLAPGPEPAAAEAKTTGAFAGELGAVPCLPLPEQPLGILVKRGTAARCVRADVGHRHGESAPLTITVIQHGPKEDHSYVSDRSLTKRYVPPGFPWRKALLYAYLLSGAILGGYVVFVLSPRGRAFFRDHFWRSVWWHRFADWEAFAALLALTLFLAYSAGSVLVIDNATDSDVQLRVNGSSVGSLPRGHFVETRVGGGDTEIEVLVDGRVVESAVLRLDQNLRQRGSRIVVGRGWYLYNIAAANAYVLERPMYAPRGY
jgi:hypothetical protein